MNAEKVLVIHNTQLNEFIILNNLPKTGFLLLSSLQPFIDFIEEEHKFIERYKVEEDSEYKQIIPYIVIRNDKDETLLMQRTSKQSENRLHNKFSIGVGGHINQSDINGNMSPIFNGLNRELNEEITIGKYAGPTFKGLINDNDNNVGKYHLAVVFEIKSLDGVVKIKESDKMKGEWAAKQKLQSKYEFMETWSKIILDNE